MKQVYSFRTGLEAHDARLFLESQGIEAKVFGDNNVLETGFSFTPASAPGLFVNEEDFDRAGELLEQFFDQPEHRRREHGSAHTAENRSKSSSTYAGNASRRGAMRH